MTTVEVAGVDDFYYNGLCFVVVDDDDNDDDGNVNYKFRVWNLMKFVSLDSGVKLKRKFVDIDHLVIEDHLDICCSETDTLKPVVIRVTESKE